MAVVTDRLPAYGAALRKVGLAERQISGSWLNNRAKNSHLPLRSPEEAMAR